MTRAPSGPSRAVQELSCRIRVLIDSANSRDLGPQTEQAFKRLLHKAKYGWQAEVVLRELLAAMASNLATQAAQVGQRLCARYDLPISHVKLPMSRTRPCNPMGGGGGGATENGCFCCFAMPR